MSEAIPQLSRTERETQLKDKAGWVITVLAGLLAINGLVGGNNSSKILNDTIAANDTWAFYQAKSMKQTAYEIASLQAAGMGNKAASEQYAARAATYESDPATGEGKKELREKALALEAERMAAKQRGPWFTYAGSLLQIAIVLLTASILSVSTRLFNASLAVGAGGAVLMSQAAWLWMPVAF